MLDVIDDNWSDFDFKQKDMLYLQIENWSAYLVIF